MPGLWGRRGTVETRRGGSAAGKRRRREGVVTARVGGGGATLHFLSMLSCSAPSRAWGMEEEGTMEIRRGGSVPGIRRRTEGGGGGESRWRRSCAALPNRSKQFGTARTLAT